MSIIKKIFITEASKTEKNIKKNADAIYAECLDYFDSYNELKGSDARRDYFLTSQYRYLYEIDGKLNMSDAKKPKAIMNGTNKNIAEKMRKIAELKEEFYAWVNNGEQTLVSSLQGVYDAIKPKPIKEETEETTEETSEETKTDKRTNDELFKNFMSIWYSEKDENGKATRGHFWDYLNTLSDDKIAELMPTLKERKAS